jgi:predicted outer membrane repeat protein
VGSGFLDPWPSDPLIEHNVVTENTSYVNGGGIRVVGVASPEIRGNRISRNWCRTDGGGIWVYVYSGTVNITENVILENTAGDHGGGIYAFSATINTYVFIELNEIRSNVAKGERPGDSGAGGGAELLAFRGVVRRNTIVLNIGEGESENGGGGLLLDATPQGTTISENVIASNVGTGIAVADLGNTHFLTNLLWANEGGDLATGIRACPPEWAERALIADPLFCDPANDDYHVASNSPALTDSMTFGCYPEPGCGAMTAPTTWDRIRRSRR